MKSAILLLKRMRRGVIPRRQLVVWVVSVALVTASLVTAQTNQAQQQPWQRLPQLEPIGSFVAGVRQPALEPVRLSISEDGYARYLGAPPAYQFRVSSAAPGDLISTARSFLKEQAQLFGLKSAAVDFRHLKTRTSTLRHNVRFEQTYAGIPVFAAQIIVQFNVRGGIECVISDVERDTKALDSGTISLTQKLAAEEAVAKARSLLGKEKPGLAIQITSPQLMIFSPSVMGEPGATQMVWEMKAASENATIVNEQLLLDANTGDVVRRYPLNHEALNRQIYDSNSTPDAPGTLIRSEGGAASTIADVNAAYNFLGDTYNFYFNRFGRISIDNPTDGSPGMILSATVRHCSTDPDNPSGPPICPMIGTACWCGQRLYFGPNWVLDDIVGHEFTHGVTQFDSGLFYANASGAINESLSDVFGEFIDLTNGSADDTAAVRWLVSETPGGGFFRSMSNPPAAGDPDRLGSPLFRLPTITPTDANDKGGVHHNSGVNNKLCYLLTDGDTFNGQTVTGMGISRVAALYYEANANLTSAADFADLNNALTQAAITLNWTVSERNNLSNACTAVEINIRPIFVAKGDTCSVRTGRLTCDPNLGGSPTLGGPFLTVTQGANAILPGGVLYIRTGNYNEVITINKRGLIRAYDGTVTIGQP